ncbi:hypothetical protein JKY79_03340, partial [Candidatus Babeliales bacterium]|nr:hypothetical protein [Candidatus Babeliales bacterium]
MDLKKQFFIITYLLSIPIYFASAAFTPEEPPKPNPRNYAPWFLPSLPPQPNARKHQDFDFGYYSEKNLSRINKINNKIIELNQDEEVSPKQNLRKKHAPLYIFADPNNWENKNNGPLQTTFHALTTIPWYEKSPLILINASVLSQFINKLQFDFLMKDFFNDLGTKYILYYLETTSLFLFVPKWFEKSYNLNSCFKNLNIQQQGLLNIQKLEPILNSIAVTNKSSFLDDMKNIFVSNEQSPIWDIWMLGHGDAGKAIAGLELNPFLELLQFFEESISVGSLMIESCHIGGQNSKTIEKSMKRIKMKKFHIFLASIGETVSYSARFNENPDPTDYSRSPLDPRFNAVVKNYFNDTTYLDCLKKIKDMEASEEKKHAKLALNHIFQGLIERVSIGVGSLTKGEYLPYFKLSNSEGFKTIKDIPNFYIINKKNNDTINHDIAENRHTIIMEVSSAFKLTLRPSSMALKNVNLEIRELLQQNLAPPHIETIDERKRFINKSPIKTYPTFIFLTHKDKPVFISTINLIDENKKIGLHSFFASFLTTNIQNFPEIRIQELSGINDIDNKETPSTLRKVTIIIKNHVLFASYYDTQGFKYQACLSSKKPPQYQKSVLYNLLEVSPEIVKILQKKKELDLDGIDINKQDDLGKTILHRICTRAETQAFINTVALFDTFDFDIKDNDQKTAVDYAKESKNHDFYNEVFNTAQRQSDRKKRLRESEEMNKKLEKQAL